MKISNRKYFRLALLFLVVGLSGILLLKKYFWQMFDYSVEEKIAYSEKELTLSNILDFPFLEIKAGKANEIKLVGDVQLLEIPYVPSLSLKNQQLTLKKKLGFRKMPKLPLEDRHPPELENSLAFTQLTLYLPKSVTKLNLKNVVGSFEELNLKELDVSNLSKSSTSNDELIISDSVVKKVTLEGKNHDFLLENNRIETVNFDFSNTFFNFEGNDFSSVAGHVEKTQVNATDFLGDLSITGDESNCSFYGKTRGNLDIRLKKGDITFWLEEKPKNTCMNGQTKEGFVDLFDKINPASNCSKETYLWNLSLESGNINSTIVPSKE